MKKIDLSKIAKENAWIVWAIGLAAGLLTIFSYFNWIPNQFGQTILSMVGLI